MRFQLLIIILLLASTTLSKAQNEIHLSHLGMDDGFTNSRANAIIQDRKGFIWVGTWNGLNRYDGYSCVTFQPHFHDSTSVAGREIVSLMEDSHGKIWIGTSSGLSCYHPKTGKFRNYKFNNRILSLAGDSSSHAIWVGTWNGGLFKLIPSTGEITHYLANDIVSDILIDSRKIMWVATYHGLLRYDKKTNSFTRFLPQPGTNSVSHPVITQVLESADGKLWLGTWGEGLEKVDVRDHGKKLHFTHYKSRAGKGSINASVISRLYYDQYHNLWIGTWNDGLRLLRETQQKRAPEQAQFITYREEPDNPTSLSRGGVSALCVDHNGVLWAGAATIDRASIIQTGIQRYRLPQIGKKPVSSTIISTFAEYKKQLWVGSNNRLYQYELQHGKYVFRKAYSKPGYQLGTTRYASRSILDIAADSTGLWVGTEDAGLVYYPFTSNYLLDKSRWLIFNQQTHPAIPGNKVCCLTISKKYPGVIWCGTMQNGFAKIIRKGRKISAVKSYYSGSTSQTCTDNNVRAVYEDHEGKVWVGTQNGLNCLDPQTNQFQRFFYSSNNKNTINDNVINAIHEDRYGNLWIGTNSGLNRRILTTDKNGQEATRFKGYPNLDFLDNEIVTNLLEDESGNLWVRLYRGLIKLNIANESIAGEYLTRDYENLWLYRHTALKYNDGQFILGDQSGFLTFYPDSISGSAYPPNVVITDCLVFNKSIQRGSNKLQNGDQETTIPYAKHLQLSYKDKMVTLVFSAMDYKNPKKNMYYYKLDGFDEQWNNIGSRNSATYTNIPSGKYAFKVKARNGDGNWSKGNTELVINVSPPWWKTPWAYIIYGIIIAGLLYFFRKYSFIKAREKSHLKFEKMKAEEITRLNELKSLFFTDITHELKTPLTLILGPARELLNDKSLSAYATKQAELIKNSGYKLLRLVNQLMEFRKIEKGAMDELFIQPCDINTMLKEISDFFMPMAESRNIHFTLHLDDETLVVGVDTVKIEKVIFNLISNAFKYSKDGGMIAVKVALRNISNGKQILIFEVQDNGIGIPKEYKERVFERFFQVNQIRTQSTGGVGLYMAKALVEQHGGEIELESEWGKGSCFRVSIPVVTSMPHQKDTTHLSEEFVNEYIANDHPEKDETEVQYKSQEDKPKPVLLIVEDDGDLNDFLVSGLADEFQTINAFNGKEALESAKKQNPDLILTDIMMPEMDGFEFCQLIRKDINTSHIPVVFLTAKTMQEDEIKGLKLGAVDYIYKPFNLVSLRLKIRNILATRQQIQEQIRKEQILEPESIELSSLDEIFLKNAVESVSRNMDNPNFDVEAFSRELGASSNQVYRKIKALTGQTAKEFIRTQRLKMAASLLAQRKRSISEVIYMVGFTSPSYFTRCFKEFYGCTPKEYMENNGDFMVRQ